MVDGPPRVTTSFLIGAALWEPRWVPRSQQLGAAGDSAFLAEAERLDLPTPTLPASAATKRGLLAPPLRSLAVSLAPRQMVVDYGGEGQCGPNTISGLLGLVGLFDGCGLSLRIELAEFGRKPEVRRLPTPFKWSRAPHEQLLLGELMRESMSNWPEDFRLGNSPLKGIF